MARDDPLSALVVLRPADGRELDGTESITAETVHRFTADPLDAQTVAQYFATKGFETTPAGPLGLSVTGRRKLFEKSFGTKLKIGQVPSGVTVATPAGTELPLDGIPRAIRSLIQAVAFDAPPDFGPGAP